MWISPENLALVVEEIIPDIVVQDADDFDNLGQCAECGADLMIEGCPSCEFPSDY